MSRRTLIDSLAFHLSNTRLTHGGSRDVGELCGWLAREDVRRWAVAAGIVHQVGQQRYVDHEILIRVSPLILTN